MKKRLKLFAILLTIVFSVFNFAIKSSVIVNATYVEGSITQNTIWTLVDSPFVVSKDVRVYPNATLTIEPGVEVKFGGTFSIIISGKLYANGTDKTITFTSNKEEPNAGDWNALIFNGTEESTLIGCFIAYAKNGILVDNSTVEVKKSTISLCFQNGINATDSELTVQDNIILENNGNGICITGNGQVIMHRNTIIANGNGIVLAGNETSGVIISQNRISVNKQNGIQIDADNHYDIIIVNNNISSNDKGFHISSQTSTYITKNYISYNNIGVFYDKGSHTVNYTDIYNNQMGMDVTSNATVNAEYNYWGHESGPYHESLNPSGKGNPVGGDGVNLDFIFFLTASIDYNNTYPTAILWTDKTLVAPNQTVTFIGTDSHDDGRVDQYFFDFGDGMNSSWTTLSLFTHNYSSTGIYNATLAVMDDFGATSDNTVTINVQEGLSPLNVNMDISDYVVCEREQVSIAVYVTNGGVALENVDVTIFSVKGGSFSSGLTNATGYFLTTFTAPDVTEITNVRIIARASKSGYADGVDHKYLEVLPFLSVNITAPDEIESEETAQITVHVKSNEQSVTYANVTISSDDGNLYPETGITDSNGTVSFVFTAPQTTTSLNVTITAIATKSGYMNGTVQTIITTEPNILAVQVIAESNVTISEAKLNVTVHVMEHDIIPIAGANVTVMAENGNFSMTTGLTDIYGNVTFIFTAPQVNEQFNINVTARAIKAGYVDGESQLEITVNPRTFNVQMEISPSRVESEETATVTVHVTCEEDATPVAGALVTMSSSDGNFSVMTRTTDSNGHCAFIFNAPKTTAQLTIRMTANVTKNGYMDGEHQTTITVTPKAVEEAEGGWPITIMLLILIPVVIVVIVAILIKKEVITVSFGD